MNDRRHGGRMRDGRAHSSFIIHHSYFFGYLLNALYLAVILIALPWLLYQRLRTGKYREGWPAKFWGLIPERTGKNACLWLHAVSVGEVNLLEPIIKRWQRLHPDWDLVISAT